MHRESLVLPIRDTAGAIQWPVTSEQWCHFIFKVGNKYYTVRSATDLTSPVYEFTFNH